MEKQLCSQSSSCIFRKAYDAYVFYELSEQSYNVCCASPALKSIDVHRKSCEEEKKTGCKTDARKCASIATDRFHRMLTNACVYRATRMTDRKPYLLHGTFIVQLSARISAN